MSTLTELRNAGFYRQGRWLVHDINLLVRSGEIITLIGPNGSGKSTIAKLALGLLRPSSGSSHLSSDICLAYMPQELVLDWTLPLSVRRLMCLTSRPSETEILDALRRTGVDHLIDSPLAYLSGGERQRVLLARAIVRRPDFLILDEPVKGVDINAEEILYELIGSLRDELGCGILLISHDLHVVMSKSDRVVCVNGHICCEGTPDDVSSAPEYLSLFHHNHNHTHLADGRVVSQKGTNE